MAIAESLEQSTVTAPQSPSTHLIRAAHVSEESSCSTPPTDVCGASRSGHSTNASPYKGRFEYVGDHVFRNCRTMLAVASLPGRQLRIGCRGFAGCESLQAINISPIVSKLLNAFLINYPNSNKYIMQKTQCLA
jgi:hypothetical protein